MRRLIIMIIGFILLGILPVHAVEYFNAPRARFLYKTPNPVSCSDIDSDGDIDVITFLFFRRLELTA